MNHGKPYFDKYQKCYAIHSNFVRDEWRLKMSEGWDGNDL